MEPALLEVRREGAVAHVVLSRPDVRNAFNAALIAALHATFDDARARDEPSGAIVLSGGRHDLLRRRRHQLDARVARA